MNINKILSQFTKEELQKLAAAMSAEEVSELAKSFNTHTLRRGGV